MISTKLIVIGIVVFIFLIIYFWIYNFGKIGTLRFLIFLRDAKLSYFILTMVLLLILLILFYNTNFYEYVTAILYIFIIVHISLTSKAEYWEKLFPSLIGGIVAGLILLLLVTDQLVRPNLRLLNFVLIMIALTLMAYFYGMRRLEFKSKM